VRPASWLAVCVERPRERRGGSASVFAEGKGQNRLFKYHFVLLLPSRMRVATGGAPSGTLATAMASPGVARPRLYAHTRNPILSHSLPLFPLAQPLFSTPPPHLGFLAAAGVEASDGRPAPLFWRHPSRERERERGVKR
jgi:hypothetical protein